MTKYIVFTQVFLILNIWLACSEKTKPEDPAVWNKVKIDLNRLDENGLAGPPDGKVAVNYEFCIPASNKEWNEVKKIDKTLQLYKDSKGRISCDKDSWLVVGSTHQKNYRRVIYELAVLDYVKQIQETFFE
ncbi:MAG: hypothetical protein DYG98_13205 [Haliscomenobacteraceae bacterium CHB4]|nr:hypothetical protein [Saprospiraceae bacterium]MCE7924009.1 hypothetical protein [Haliscomenobacteraceae bacterium CHB4]